MSTQQKLPTLIRAEIYILSTETGGRQHPVLEGYRPHLVVPALEEYLGVYLVSIDNPAKMISPGEKGHVVFGFVYEPDVDYSSLVPSTEFEIREGSRVVGKGKVLERA